MGDSSGKPRQEKGSGQFTFFQRLIALLLGGDDSDREKRRQLKQIATELSRQRYKFYKPRSGEALPGLAKFLFEIYRLIGPAQSLLQGSENSKALKTIVIELFESEAQAEARERFSEESIRELAGTRKPKDLVAEVKDAMSAYVSGFDSTVIHRINTTYSLIQQLGSFARFDFYFVLRKFDTSFAEGNYTQPPRAGAINAEYVSDDLKDFLEVLLPLDHDADWDSALEALRIYRGVDVVAAGPWKKLLSQLSSVVRSGVLVQIVRHVDGDPGFKPLAREERHHIVENQLNVLKTQVEGHMQKLTRQMKGQRVRSMVKDTFGTVEVHSAKYYTEKRNEEFAKRMIAGFSHTEAFNYLSAFLLDYFSVDVRALISEILIVRATWSDNSVSSQLSEAFYEILSNTEAVERFDLSLGDDGELALKLKKAAGPVKSKDASASRLLRQVVHDIDERALNLITETAQDLITVGRIIKNLIEDLGRRSPELILNWRELESLSEISLKKQLVDIYQKIYNFVRLMQSFVGK